MAKTAKAKAPAKKHAWQIEAEKRGQEIDENVAMLRDGSDEYLVGIAREALHHYHAAMMACDKPGRLPYELVIEACVETLYRIEEYGGREERADGSGRFRSRFNCWNSASSWLGKQLAAPDGEIPMHGQPGRFMLTIHSCRTDVRYPGVFGGVGLDGRVIDLDQPFFSETGYRSFTGGGLSRERWFVEEAMTVDEMLTISMEHNLLIDHHGKVAAKCKLHNPPFGLAHWQGNKRHDADDSRLREERRNDPAYQPGGFIHALPGLAPIGIPSRVEKTGQLAFAF
ncbi:MULTISPECIES: hypothetical protein [unclassified Mesorhizobium]|uniref:hypothetical protein n=1 Tax=unclassified Mesorhizobium TaxID=325217 RepID=UPI000FDBD0B3|nr:MULTISPECIES: hypothetical protein [unclassified Mesorhizobium]TGV90086.1 hypothetical protein EN801_020755 [Mesorhizobium sp. M00.F.Ca.ET.158.01.1.1]RWI97844.1 MAG: hypothetical protein EOR22_05770 [Mesorhizobium sp.]TGQ19179.1 hypothetical protein EN860_022330 [Mesorhizobium sp. M00.F.Ca.ET.217.01.1.1]TIQ93944.1 MAG: hypothetical protein E5X36_28130 [Mesorhizobium sp.]TIR22170.1 MAG: hypothetical protein E5X33_09575 [Mesorhizobium sp.]